MGAKPPKKGRRNQNRSDSGFGVTRGHKANAKAKRKAHAKLSKSCGAGLPQPPKAGIPPARTVEDEIRWRSQQPNYQEKKEQDASQADVPRFQPPQDGMDSVQMDYHWKPGEESAPPSDASDSTEMSEYPPEGPVQRRDLPEPGAPVVP